MELAGKVCLVTGASGGIGEALGDELAAAGAKVVLFARRKERLEEIVARIGSERAAFVAGDVSDPAAIQLAVETAINRFGGLDILVNNAGVAVMGYLKDVPPELVERGFRTNVFGPILVTQIALPAMVSRGGGMIVNVSSAMSLRASPSMGIYSATKAAFNVISATMREEVRDHGINVMTVHPGFIANEFGLNTLSADDDLVRSRRESSLTRSSRTSEDAARDIVAAIRSDSDTFRSTTATPLQMPM